MIDSFYRWSRQNPKGAKKLEDFIADGLLAAAKRCQSCLSRELGIEFKEEDEVLVEETSESADVPVFFEESVIESAKPTATPEISPEIEAPPTSEPVSDEEFHEPFDIIDSDATSVKETPRDFSSEFELVEPESLIIKPQEPELETPPDFEVTGPPEPDTEEFPEITESIGLPSDLSFESTTVDSKEPILVKSIPDSPEEKTTSVDESDIQEDTHETEEITHEEPESPIPLFSWDTHHEPTTTPEDAHTEPAEPEESTPATVRIWSPYDEPSISSSDIASDSESTKEVMEEDTEEIETDTSSTGTEEPPAPPPPPESDESEEERKRRARRLFFGT
jgi:hypothetical protein